MNEEQNAKENSSKPCLWLKKMGNSINCWAKKNLARIKSIKKNPRVTVPITIAIFVFGLMKSFNTFKTFTNFIWPPKNSIGSIEKKLGIDCTNLSDNTWIKDENITTDKQYLFLKDNQQIGSIRLSRTFFDAFILNLRFIPYAIEGINMTISIKDDFKNELGITIGDGDYKSYRVVIKKEGEIIKEKNSQLNPTIKSNEEVVFQVETTQLANSLLVSSFIIYTPNKKPGKTIPKDFPKENIPYFSKNSVHLNIGLRKTARVDNPKIKLINCEIHEKNF
jgi:hypothetical protein